MFSLSPIVLNFILFRLMQYQNLISFLSQCIFEYVKLIFEVINYQTIMYLQKKGLKQPIIELLVIMF